MSFPVPVEYGLNDTKDNTIVKYNNGSEWEGLPTQEQGGSSGDIADIKRILSEITESGTVIIDKNKFGSIDAYIPMTATNLSTDEHCKTAYFKCLPLLKYKVEKMKSARFRVAYTIETPADGVTAYDIQADNDATELTIETGANAEYLAIYYFDSQNDTLSQSEIYETLQVTYETELTAVDKIAREAI